MNKTFLNLENDEQKNDETMKKTASKKQKKNEKMSGGRIRCVAGIISSSRTSRWRRWSLLLDPGSS
jgi:hypothetical protein